MKKGRRGLSTSKLGENTLATHRYKDAVLVREAGMRESVIAQAMLGQFSGFRLLYTPLVEGAEGVAECVTKER
jgi:hypothetical protein